MPQRSVSEPALALEAQQLAILLDSSRELIAVLGSDGALLFANRSFRFAFGDRSEGLLGKQIANFVHALDVGTLRENLAEISLKSDGLRSDRCRFRGRDGSWRWIQFTCQNKLSAPGLEGILFHGSDVTDLHRMESEREVNSEIVHALNETAHLDQLLKRIHFALKRILPADNCFVALHEPVNDTFAFPFFVDEYDTAPSPQKVGRSCTAFVFRTGKAKLIPQSYFDELAEAGEVELVGSPSPAWLGVPLKTPTATIGVLVVQHYQNESAYDLRDLEFLESVGGHIALAIERRRAEEGLRRNESMLRLLFEHNPLPTWLYEIDSLRFLRVNQAATQLYGYSTSEFERMTILDIYPEDRKSTRLNSSH